MPCDTGGVCKTHSATGESKMRHELIQSGPNLNFPQALVIFEIAAKIIYANVVKNAGRQPATIEKVGGMAL